MRSIWIIFRREILSAAVLFRTYGIIAGVGVLSAFFFFNLLGRYNFILSRMAGMQLGDRVPIPTLQSFVVEKYFEALLLLLIVIVPVLCMRSFAEERSTGVNELFWSSTVSEGKFVIAKFLSVASILTVIVAVATVFPLLLIAYGTPDLGALISGALGVYLVSLSFIAVSFAVSATARSQVSAAILAIGTLALFCTLHAAVKVAPSPWNEIASALSPVLHATSFARGEVTLFSLVYLLSIIFLGLSAARVSLISERSNQ